MRRKEGDMEPFAGNFYTLWIMNFKQTLRTLFISNFIMRINIEAEAYAKLLTNPCIGFFHRTCYAADL
jgi:hypothetical protein